MGFLEAVGVIEDAVSVAGYVVLSMIFSSRLQ